MAEINKIRKFLSFEVCQKILVVTWRQDRQGTEKYKTGLVIMYVSIWCSLSLKSMFNMLYIWFIFIGLPNKYVYFLFYDFRQFFSFPSSILKWKVFKNCLFDSIKILTHSTLMKEPCKLLIGSKSHSSPFIQVYLSRIYVVIKF